MREERKNERTKEQKNKQEIISISSDTF